MNQRGSLFFDAVAIIFVVLTVLVIIVVVSIASGTMDAPLFAPKGTPIPPTRYVPPTLTPSPAPGAALTPTVEVTQAAQ